MFFKVQNHYKFLIYIFFLILIGCKLQEPTKNHGILFLENRSNQLKVKVNNKNDVKKMLGSPHTKSVADEDTWIYLERVLTKGEFLKLGQNVVKENNVLVLKFDKYGVLTEKNFLDKEDIRKISFSKKTTENSLTTRSFVEAFLSSVKQKMYGNKK